MTKNTPDSDRVLGDSESKLPLLDGPKSYG